MSKNTTSPAVATLKEAEQLWPKIELSKRSKDLTGQKFNKLTCLYPTTYLPNKKVNWVCECECGQYTMGDGYSITAGRKQSCGCEKTKVQNNLIGQRFDKLLVLGLDEEFEKIRKSGQHRKWKCQCDCGNICSRYENILLRNNHRYSCGCLHKENQHKFGNAANLIGQKFGMLTPIKSLGLNSKRQQLWECQCDCGNITQCTTNALTYGSTISCGCAKGTYWENQIEEILINLDIKYKREYRFSDLKDKLPLRFDYALFNNEDQLIGLIEYQGEQHFDSTHIYYKESMVIHDQMKKDYCQKNNIPLLELFFTDKNNFTEKIVDFLKKI